MRAIIPVLDRHLVVVSADVLPIKIRALNPATVAPETVIEVPPVVAKPGPDSARLFEGASWESNRASEFLTAEAVA